MQYPYFEIRLFDISQPRHVSPVKSKKDLIDILYAPLRQEIIADPQDGAACACGSQLYSWLLELLLDNSENYRNVIFCLDYWYFFDEKRTVRTFVCSGLTRSWRLTNWRLKRPEKIPDVYDAIDFWKTAVARLPSILKERE